MLFFLARRLYAHGGGRASRLGRLLAETGVVCGIVVMVVSVAVCVGFKREIRAKIATFGGHIEVVNLKSLQTGESEPIRFSAEMLEAIKGTEGVSRVVPYCEKTGMIKTDETFRAIVVRGRADSPVALSRTLSSELKVVRGDKLYAYFFEGGVRARRLAIDSIYDTHLRDFDRRVVFAPLRLPQSLQGWDEGQYSGLEIYVADFDELDNVAQRIASLLLMKQDSDGAYYAAPTIRDRYPSLFSWLSLLDTNVWVILALMALVAAFTMVSGIIIIMLERTRFIGVMKALGATNAALRRLFLLYAALIALRGLALGNIVAFALIAAQRAWGFLRLDPDTYYVDTVPMTIPPLLLLAVNVATLLVLLLSLLLPTYIIHRVEPAKSIRYE